MSSQPFKMRLKDYVKELQTFACCLQTNIPDRYSRYVLILYEGGLLVLTSTLHEKLNKQRKNLASILHEKRNMLSILVQKAKEVIFDDSGKINTDVSTWGLSLLADVLLYLFPVDLNTIEKKAISAIKKANEDYAVSALASIDEAKFREYWTDIIKHISTLSVLQNEETHSECDLLIKKHDKDPIDEDVVKHYLRQILQDCRPESSLVDLYKDTRKKLKDALDVMKNKGVKFGKEHEIDLKMMTIGKSDEKKKLAEETLYTASQKVMKMTDGSDDFEEIKEAFEKILETIRNMEDVKIKSIEKHCIILAFKSASPTGLLDLINYTNSRTFFREMEKISESLTEYLDENITVTTFLTIESMKQTFDTLTETDASDDDQCTNLKLACTSVNAIKNVTKLMDDIATENVLNDVAQSLSRHFDEHISIQSSLKMGCLGEVFANPLQDLHHSEWQPFFRSGIRTYHRSLNKSPHLSYLQSLIDDLQYPPRYTLPGNFEEELHLAPVHRSLSITTHSNESSDSSLDFLLDSDIHAFQTVPSLNNNFETSGEQADSELYSIAMSDLSGLELHTSSPRDTSSRSSSVCSFA